MRGLVNIYAELGDIKYKLRLKHAFTVIAGGSGSGKTNLIQILDGASNQKPGYVASCSPSYKLLVVTRAILDNVDISALSDTVAFIDEDTLDTATDVDRFNISHSKIYWVIITRKLDNFKGLHFSVLEMYKLKHAGEFIVQEPLFDLVGGRTLVEVNPFKVEGIITEDRKVGHSFFKELLPPDAPAIAADSNNNVYKKIRDHADDGCDFFVVVDGSVFGRYMNGLLNALNSIGDKRRFFAIYFTESMEWFFLHSLNFINNEEVQKVLRSPWDYIDTNSHWSRERFYSSFIGGNSSNKKDRYAKKYEPYNFLSVANVQHLLSIIPGVEFPPLPLTKLRAIEMERDLLELKKKYETKEQINEDN